MKSTMFFTRFVFIVRVVGLRCGFGGGRYGRDPVDTSRAGVMAGVGLLGGV